MFNKAKEEIAGPGHKPANAQPAPNNAEPYISFLFICLLLNFTSFSKNGFKDFYRVNLLNL